MVETNIDALYLYVEVFIAFVAFATIVATIKQAFGKKLTVLQYLLFRFFVEVGFLHVVMTLLSISLFDVLADKNEAWRYSTYSIIGIVCFYFVFYFKRRRAMGLKATLPTSSKIVSLGYVLFMLFLMITVTGLYWQASLATTLAYLLWAIVSNMIIFVQFIGTFLEVDLEEVN
jgi:hypothetical protein